MPQTLFTVLGAGSWGTALALHLARLGQPVRLWTHEKAHFSAMQADQSNQRYLPEFSFPPSLQAVESLQDAVKDTTDILIAVPSTAFRALLTELTPLILPDARFTCATKGLDEPTGQLLHEVAQEILGNTHAYAVLSGPSFAKEVASGLPTAVVVASRDEKLADDLVKRFSSGSFRVYLSTDINGVEIGGSVKNVLAIATGISDGMGFGANAKAALLTRGLAEIIRLGLALGGQFETFTGLTGLGDLVLTCTDDQSRNRRFGMHLGRGMLPEEAERAVGQVVEGKRNAELILTLAQKWQIDMPIVSAVSKILQRKITPEEAMKELLSRTPKAE